MCRPLCGKTGHATLELGRGRSDVSEDTIYWYENKDNKFYLSHNIKIAFDNLDPCEHHPKVLYVLFLFIQSFFGFS